MTAKKYPKYNKYLIYSVDIKFFCVLYFTTLCYLEKGIYTPKGVYPAEQTLLVLAQVNIIDHLLEWNSSSRRVAGEKQKVAFRTQKVGNDVAKMS